uniref:Cytochrome P450 6k1 n=2 Tax=Lygus hesperus TaxID=30085 RepID=A0A0K8ST63_LYGHE
MVFLTLVASIIVLGVIYAVTKAWKINQKWKNQGVPHRTPILFFGNLLDVVLKKRTQAEILQDIYNEFPNEPIVGYYHFLSPRIIVRDLGLVERVLIKDFVHFVDRAPPVDIKDNPLVVNLFALCGNTWRAVRAKFSPMFTTGKLRYMFPQVGNIADDFTKILDKKLDGVDIKAESGKFAMEVIGSCAFGIEPGAMDEEENEFKIEAKAAFSPALKDFARLTAVFTFPGVARRLGLQFTPPRTTAYFTKVVRSALVHRQQSKEVRKDFVQQMVTLLEKGSIDVEKEDPSDGYLNIGDKSIEG